MHPKIIPAYTSIDSKQLRQYKWENWYLKRSLKVASLYLPCCLCQFFLFSVDKCWILFNSLTHEHIEEQHFVVTERIWRWKKPKAWEIQTGPASTTWYDCCKACLDHVHQASATLSSLRISKSWLWQLCTQRVICAMVKSRYIGPRSCVQASGLGFFVW